MAKEIESVDIEQVQDLYEKYDNAVESMIAKGRELGASIPCKKGCDACCYDIALTTQFEMPPLVAAIRKMSDADKRKIRAQIVEWTSALGEKSISLNADDVDVRRYHAEPRAACPLLNRQTRECMVYDQRPLSCRSHVLVNQEPSACANRAVEPEITCLMVQDLAAQGIVRLVSLHAKKKAESIGVGVLMLGSMLLKAWPLVEQQSEPDYVEWLEGIVRDGTLKTC